MKNKVLILAIALLLTADARAQSEGLPTWRGAEAIKQLKETGSYESLRDAMRGARKKGGQTDDLPAPEGFGQSAKRPASPDAAGDQFGFSVAISGDTAVIGAANDRVGTNNSQGSAYIFVRSGTTWTQQTQLLLANGAATDQFGVSVAISGDTAIVGAKFDNLSVNSFRGSAYIFVRSGTTWTQQAKLLPGAGGINDRFGSSVAVSGDTVVVGASQDNSAYVYIRSGTTWTQQARLLATNRQTGTSFGTSVGISGETAVIGNTSDSIGTNSQQGSAYVFVRSGTTWTQQAQLIAADGGGGDVFGISIAISGETAIVGSLFHDVGANSDQGAAYVFVRSGTSWTQQAQLLAANGAANNRFGAKVAISGNTVVVGANLALGGAYVFTRGGTAWTQQMQLFATDGSASDDFGSGVAISGDTAVVGADFDDVGFSTNQGSAYIFVRSGTTWTQQAQVSTAQGDDLVDEFGISVAISGDTVIVGADGDDVGTGFDQGSAYVFVWNGTTWTQQAQLFAADGVANDGFAGSVAISGDTAVVGASLDDVGPNVAQGSVYVFVRSGTVWTQQAQFFAADGAAFDDFGSSVAIGGDTVVVGVFQDDVGANISQGSAYVFVRNGMAWTQQAQLFAADGAANDQFGGAVTISGDTAVVGAEFDDVGANADQGSAYVFIRSGTTWTQQAKLTLTDGAAFDAFGVGVTISGDTAIVGAFQRDVGTHTSQGSAYVFVRSGTTWTRQAQLVAADGAAFDGLGFSVAIIGDTAIVGALQDDIGANISQGSAYIFVRSGTTWAQQTKFFDSTGARDDNFGYSVAISGNRIVAGAPFGRIGSSSSERLSRPVSVDQGAALVFVIPPVAPAVSISGRVFTPDGGGLRNARVILTDSNGVARSVITNSFGSYQFLSVQSGMTYTIGVASKRFRFSSRALPVTDNLTNVDFVGIE